MLKKGFWCKLTRFIFDHVRFFLPPPHVSTPSHNTNVMSFIYYSYRKTQDCDWDAAIFCLLVDVNWGLVHDTFLWVLMFNVALCLMQKWKNGALKIMAGLSSEPFSYTLKKKLDASMKACLRLATCSPASNICDRCMACLSSHNTQSDYIYCYGLNITCSAQGL